MLGLEYGSDDDSDSETVELPKSVAAPASSSSGLQLPPPTSKSTRRKDGPVRIKIDALQPSTDSTRAAEPAAKKARVEESASSSTGRGAGASSLVSMLSKLPAPKAAAPPAAKPAQRVLGGGSVSSYDGPGVIMGADDWDYGETSSAAEVSSVVDTTPATSFMPASVSKPKAKTTSTGAATSLVPPSLRPSSIIPKLTPKPAAPAVDFFSLGTASSSRATPSVTPIHPLPSTSISISSAPKVTEYEPPPPSTADPYPGYYQKPSGDWAAYDPAYYKSFWESWNTDAVSGGGGEKGKRKERGWEGAEKDDLQSVDAREEMQRGQIAQREAQKALTGAPKPTLGAPAAPNMKIKVKAGGGARRKGQLSSLLAEAYENREAIEQQIADGRRNRKESGTKYGF